MSIKEIKAFLKRNRMMAIVSAVASLLSLVFFAVPAVAFTLLAIGSVTGIMLYIDVIFTVRKFLK